MLGGAIKLVQSELGVGVAPKDLVAARRLACESCDQWDHGRCKACGCFTWAKTRLKSERCPLRRWPGEEDER